MQAGQEKATLLAGQPMEQKPLTVGENLDRAIGECNQRIADLLKLREEAQRMGVLHLSQPLMSSLAYPGGPF